jgi:hypothetical protein
MLCLSLAEVQPAPSPAQAYIRVVQDQVVSLDSVDERTTKGC